MDKLKKLYDVLVRDGYYTKSFDDFQNQYSDPSYQDKVFNVVTRDGLFTKSREEFLTIYSPIQKKNQVGTPSTLEKVDTESVIEVETEPGSLVSADLAVDGDQYLETDIERLLEIETVPERTFTPGASARARAMEQQQRKVDPELKRKFLSDFNISSAINSGIIDEEDLNSALRGNKGNIEKLKQLAVTSPDKYTQKILDKRLNKPFAFEESSDLVEFVTPEGEDEKKAAIRKKIIAYDAESKRLQDENPNATAEELSAILNRPDDPNFVTDEEYELVEDDFIPTGFEGSDVDNMYDTQMLKSVKGFNIKDFDGYLNEQGYKKEYLRLLEGGRFSDDGASFDFSKRYNPSLAAERVKLQYLTNYINNQIERNVESQVLDYQSKNNGRHPSFDGVQLSFSSGVDDKQLTKYIEEEFPIMTSKLKQRDVKNEELYQSMKEGEIRGVGQAFKQGWRSVEDRINNYSAGAYDYIGLDNVADEIRMTQAETELEREDFMRYTYASGKEAYVGNTKYLVDDKGQVYDTDLGLRVTDVLTPKELSSIKAVVENMGEESSTFSTAGMIIQGTGIASDMLLQIALTKGAGNVGRGGAAFLGAFGRGKKVVDIMSAIPMRATTASAMVAQGTLFSTNLAEQSYKQALEGGLSIEQAEEVQSIAGAQGLALGVVTAPISTQTYAMDKIFGRGGKDALVKGALKAYEKAGAKGAKAFWNKALQKAKIYALESGKEVVQENVQQVGQTYVIGENVNEYAKKEIMANTISGDDFINTTILSAAAGFFMPFAGDVSSGARTSVRDRFMPGAKAIDRLTALDVLSKNVDKTTQLLNSQVTKGLYTEEQVKNILKDIDVYRKTINSIPPNLSPETALSIITDVQEIRKQEELKKQRDPAFHQDIDNKIKELRDGIVKKTNFDYLDNQTKIKLKDEALTELTKEAEDRGEKDFKIDDGQATYRAIENFNKLSTQEKLDLAKIKKVTPEVTPKVKEEKIKDSQIPISQQKFTYEDDNGQINTAKVTTQLDGSRKLELLDEQGGVGVTERISKDNTLTSEEYVTMAAGDIKSTEDVDIKTVRSPKLESKMSDRQRKAAGMDVTPEVTPEVDEDIEITPGEMAVNVAPFFATSVESVAEASDVRKTPEYQQYKQSLIDLANDIGVEAEVDESVGGYVNDAGTKIREVSNVVKLQDATLEQAQEFAALAAALAPEVQESSIAATTTEVESPTHNADAVTIKVSDPQATFEALQEVGIDEFTLNESTNLLTLLDVHAFRNDNFFEQRDALLKKLKEKNVQYELNELEALNSEFVGKDKRRRVLSNARKRLIQQGQKETNVYRKVLSAIKRDAESLGVSPSEYVSTVKPKEEVDVVEEAEVKLSPRITQQIDNAKKALESVDANIKIIVHKNEEAYAEATNEQNRLVKTAGEYNPQTKTININPEKANERTVAHEAFHAILVNLVKTNAEAQRLTRAMMKAVSKVASPELKKYLDKFAKNYEKNIQSEEKLAELVGKLASEYDSLPKPTQNIIKRWLDRLAKVFGLKPFTDAEVIDVLNTISGKLATGEAITQQDLSSVQSNAKYVSTDEAKLWGTVPVKKQIRTKPDPKKTVKAYKMFRVKKTEPGKLFPLFVKADEEVLMNTWIDAEVGELTKEGKVKSKIGNLAFRPGWHMGDTPIATHIGDKYNFEKGETDKSLKKPTARSANHVWAEVEVSADVDWQKEANSRAKKTKDGKIIPRTAQISDQVPEDGYYRYKTNPNMTGNWLIGGSIKVTRVLTDEEVKAINDEAGVADLPRVNPLNLQELGFEAEVVADKDVSALKGGKVVSNPIEFITRKQVGEFDVQYTEANKIQELIGKNLLVEVNDVSSFSDMIAAITSPDDMLAGTVSIDGVQIFEGGGGIFFVTKYGDVWASGNEQTAKTLAKMINDSFDANGGRGFLVLTKGDDQKLISSVSGVKSSLSVLEVMLDKNLISLSDFRSAISQSVKKEVYNITLNEQIKSYKKKNNLKKNDRVPADKLTEMRVKAKKVSDSKKGFIKLSSNSKQLKTDIQNYFSDPSTSTFQTRGNVVKDILGRLAQSKSANKNSAKIIKLLGGNPSKKLGKGRTKLSQSLGDLVAGIAAEQLTKGLSVGDVYGIIEVKSKVESVEDSHPSYPFHVKTIDGSKPKLFLIKNRQNGSEVLKTSTGKTYKVGNVSVMSGSFNPDIKPRKQVADGDANLIESFANRIITQKGITEFSEEALQFYAENQEAIDALVSQKRKGLPKDKSKERSLALKIARGDTDFSDADIDLYASSKENVQAEVEAIGRTRNKTITSDTYKSILAATKSTTRRDKAKPESENVQRKRFWASWNRSAREQKMSLAQKRKSLNDAVKAYAKDKKGTITTAQTRAVINKINTVNLDNPAQVKKVQEYVEKVFKNADFANDLSIAKKLTVSATKRLNSGKLGDNGNFNAAVSQLVMLPLSDLDPSDLKNYNEFLKKIAKRNKKTKLDNELVKEANEILNSIKSKEIESESELQYDETKGFIYKEGTQKVINKILDPKVDGETIIEENSEFLENKLDALDSGTLEVLVEKVNIAENENNAEIVEQINDYAKNRQNLINNTARKSSKLTLSNLNKLTRDQSIGPRTLRNLNKGQLAMLTGTELAELGVHLDNINEGFYTYYANKIAQRVEANNRAINTNPVFDKMFTAKGKLSTVRQYISASVKNNLGKVGLPSSQAARRVGIRGQMIRSNPLSVIDQMFGNYKNNNVYDNIIRPTSQAHAKFQNWINKQTDILEAVESLLAPTLKESANAAVKRRFELTTYLLQKEFESNPNKKGVAPAIKFIEGTIDSYKSDKRSSRYNEESIAILESIAKQYSEEGQISLKKMDEAMSPKTKKALKMLEGIYSGLGELQAYATRIVRGNELDLVNDYVHHKAEYKGQERDDANFQNAINYLNIRPGTESKTSLERVGATAIDFDPITTALRATRNTGMDYYMSNEISTTRQTLAVLKKMAVRDESKTEKQKDKQLEAVIDLDKIYSEALNNVVTNNVSSEVLGGKLLNGMRTIGYYATLASLPRAGAEYASNLAFAVLSAPSEITLGMTKYAELSMSSTGRIIVEIAESTVNTKLYSKEALGGSKAETQGITRKRTAAKAKGKVKQSVEYVSRVTGVKYAPKVVDKIGESLIAKPDQMISRPLWFGTFAMEFKSQTGKRVNFDKIAENDSDYINEYKDAITAATKKADINVTRAATSNDPFSQVLKNQAQKGESAMNFYRMINGYMSSFSLNEYATARQAVASMAGQGQMGVIKGVTTLAGVGVRMSLYVTLLQYFNAAMFGFLGIGDDDDTDYEELGIRQAVGAATSLISRGVSGNVPMIPMNYALESLNKEYGYELGLRSKKEYDGFKHSLVYATINPSNASKNLEAATLFQLFGPFNPYAKTGTRIAKLALRAQTNKTEESRQANLNELFSERTAIEVANLFGGVPFYRDIRTGFLREQFKEDDQKGFSLDQLKILDPAEYNRIKELQKFEKQNMIKSQDQMMLEAELKALMEEIKQFK